MQVGNLTFAVSIQGAPAVAAKAPTLEGAVAGDGTDTGRRPRSPRSTTSATTMIESWLVADDAPSRPSALRASTGATRSRSARLQGRRTPRPSPAAPRPSPPPPPTPPHRPRPRPRTTTEDITSGSPRGKGTPRTSDDAEAETTTEDGDGDPRGVHRRVESVLRRRSRAAEAEQPSPPTRIRATPPRIS